ncbi:MAG: hypothetical protein N4A74_16490 [Carboxylicivirga sp.]|jgi:predicted GH43/DUF377 family glycosyl hydrolase|nr:hypothetical protein [Carboxylicivirga sp.]
MHKQILSLLFLSLVTLSVKSQKIDLSKLESPIIFEGSYKYAYRDPAVIYENNEFHLFFTVVERAKPLQMYLYTAYSKSDDLIHWTYPKMITPRDQNLNFSSPGNIVKFKNEWVICLQTYPMPNDERWGNETSRIWIRRSKDLENWSEPELLKVKGNDVAVEDMGRMIDPYLLEDPKEKGKWWCYYKQNGVSMSYSYDLKNWTYSGSANSGENVTVLPQGDELVLIHSPHNGIGFKRSKSPSEWGKDERVITLGQKDWPWANRRLTAATVIDLTKNKKVGKYIMFFHGSCLEGAKPDYNAHNNASMAIAWSDDLINWEWPGKAKD